MYDRIKIDLHIHSNVSDGTETPAEILSDVRDAGIGLFSITDHDAVKGGRIMRGIIGPDDPFFITGTEFSCKDEGGKYHILGYAYDPDAEGINKLVDTGHGYRMKKLTARLDFLKTQFGFEFSKEDLAVLFAMDNPGKPHIGRLMMKYGYAKTIREAIEDYINKKRFGAEHLRPEEAVEGILASGGIPVLAHPPFGDGDETILGDDMDQRLCRLMEMGLQGVEGFYSGYWDKLRNEMLSFAERYDLYVTAGSDFHGRNKFIELGDIGVPALEEPPAGMLRFFERIGYGPEA